MKEKDVQNEILLELPYMNARAFRVNVGVGWVGKSEKQRNGDLLLKNPRPLVTVSGPTKSKPYTGFSDLVGFTTFEVNDEFIERYKGKKIAIFTAIETKAPTGKPSDDQRTFLNMIKLHGGIAGVAKSPEDVRKIIKNHPL